MASFFPRDPEPEGRWRLWLRDEELSWYYQTPLDDLTEDERAIEEQYLKDQNLRFPLGTIPDEPGQPPLGNSSFCDP